MTPRSTQTHMRPTRRYAKATACLLALAALALTACGEDSIGGGPMDGVVLDYATKQPIDGAIISVQWLGRTNSFGAMGAGLCYYVSTTVSDSQGRFHIPPWKQTFQERGWKAGVIPEGQSIKAYKRGLYYADVGAAPNPMLPNYRDNYKEIHKTTIYMEPDVSPPAKRMERLERAYGLPCWEGDKSRSAESQFYAALYDEGKNLARSEAELLQLQYWQSLSQKKKGN